MKINKYIKLAILCAFIIGFIIGYIEPVTESTYNQQNIATSSIAELVKVSAPPEIVEMSFVLTHLDKSTTSFNIISFATPTSIGAFYRPTDGSLNIRAYNWEVYRRVGEKDKRVPLVDMSVVVHELVHMTTLYNTKDPSCKDFRDIVCQELMAYDAGNIYEQIRSFEEDGWIKLTKD